MLRRTNEAVYYLASEYELERNVSHSTALLLARRKDEIEWLASKVEKREGIPRQFALGHAEAVLFATLAQNELAIEVYEAFAIQQLVCGKVPPAYAEVPMETLREVSEMSGHPPTNLVQPLNRLGGEMSKCIRATSDFLLKNVSLRLELLFTQCGDNLVSQRCLTLAEDVVEAAEKANNGIKHMSGSMLTSAALFPHIDERSVLSDYG